MGWTWPNHLVQREREKARRQRPTLSFQFQECLTLPHLCWADRLFVILANLCIICSFVFHNEIKTKKNKIMTWFVLRTKNWKTTNFSNLWFCTQLENRETGWQAFYPIGICLLVGYKELSILSVEVLCDISLFSIGSDDLLFTENRWVSRLSSDEKVNQINYMLNELQIMHHRWTYLARR